ARDELAIDTTEAKRLLEVTLVREIKVQVLEELAQKAEVDLTLCGVLAGPNRVVRSLSHFALRSASPVPPARLEEATRVDRLHRAVVEKMGMATEILRRGARP